MDKRDTYRTAFDHLEQHGDQAAIHAAMEADARLEAGDLDGAATWRMVLRAVRGMMESGGARH
jgi:hypothetical protein